MSINYFGYGANREGGMIEAIIGRVPCGREASLEGYELCVQGLRDIPQRPREILEKTWGDFFESYVIQPCLGGRVKGILWEIMQDERERILEWELVPHGWYRNEVVGVRDSLGKEVLAETEVVLGQGVSRVVDGIDYEEFLMGKERILGVAREIFGEK
jgi:hypothetical protein